MQTLKVDENLELRMVDEKYAPETFRVVRENLEHLGKWLPFANENYTEQTARDFFRTQLEKIRENGGAVYSIFWENELIGGIGFDNFDREAKTAEIGYWLAADRQGKGIITRSCRTVLKQAFGVFGLERIFIKCRAGNLKSRAIPERLGFFLEKEPAGGESEENNETLVVYSIRREDWEKTFG
ncbi:MAG: GNAT family protein [Pyrinomonadaceae bacterium]